MSSPVMVERLAMWYSVMTVGTLCVARNRSVGRHVSRDSSPSES